MITPQDVASSDGITDLRLSRDGSRVVYTSGPLYKTGNNRTSALWLAETTIENSARKITTGDSHDYAPSFHPNASQIFFLSDRHEVGGATQLYTLSFDATSFTEANRITNSRYPVLSYSISPDGNFVAFTLKSSSSEQSVEEPISVWRENLGFDALHFIDLRDSSKIVRNLVSVNAHVCSFAWSPDSSAIVYRMLDHNNFESLFFPVKEAIVSVPAGETRDTFEYARMPGSPTIWRQNGDLAFVQSVTPSHFSSSKCLWTRPAIGISKPLHLAYGQSNDVNGIVDLGSGSQFAVEIAEGLNTRFDVFNSNNEAFTAFQTGDYSIGYLEWDMTLTEDGRYVFVAVRSSGISGDPKNVWSGVTEFGKDGLLSTKLSSHNSWFNPETSPVSKRFYWTGSDGEKLEGVISYPRGVDLRTLPTAVVPHGGPYGRDMLELVFEYWWWRPFLASHGYLVLSPNYRGSLGRGDAFAKASDGGRGTLDWSDVETMIDEGISQGIVDPDRIGIAGYSNGGFLAAWGCTRPDSRFKVGVIGAGISDWGFLAASSDMPDMEAHLGGGAPWKQGNPTYLDGSPIKDVNNAKAPLLILHGKDDARVPLTQAIAFLRGIERESDAQTKPKLVIYPREGHMFEERAHAEDVLRRLVEHLDIYLK